MMLVEPYNMIGIGSVSLHELVNDAATDETDCSGLLVGNCSLSSSVARLCCFWSWSTSDSLLAVRST